jgi:hypothetical protein
MTGWGEVDAALGGLGTGMVHEWIGAGWDGLGDGVRGGWRAPLGVVMHLARRSLAAGSRGLVVWIGEACFGYPLAMLREGGADRALVERSVLVSARTAEERAWAIDVSLRCAGVGMVIGDASGTRMVESRRFQLAAASGGGMGLLVRPPWEAGELSAAWSRWRVWPGVAGEVEGGRPGWTLELLRCKGTRPAAEGVRRWAVRVEDETGDVRLVSDAADRCAGAAGEPPGRGAGGRRRSA